MPVITYTAKRELLATHTAGTEYSLEFGITQLERSAKTQKSERRSQGGLTESLRFYHDRMWNVTTLYLDDADLEQWREWWHSVDNSEPFTFDPRGTIAVPVDPKTVIAMGDTYAERLINLNRAQISFKVRF